MFTCLGFDIDIGIGGGINTFFSLLVLVCNISWNTGAYSVLEEGGVP